MDEETAFQPVWNLELTGVHQTHSVSEHLITAHEIAHTEVGKLTLAQQIELHNQLHEQLLGGTLVGGR